MDIKIPFSIPSVTASEKEYVSLASTTLLSSAWYKEVGRLCEEGHGIMVFLTSSGTYALEIAAMLVGISAGEEVILPSYTFTSTASAFLLRNAELQFCEINPYSSNMNPTSAPSMLIKKTKVIVPVHYAGVHCNMNALAFNYAIVEDAVQAVGSAYNENPAGEVGDMGFFFMLIITLICTMIVLPSVQKRGDLLVQLNQRGIQATFHYIAIHISPLGQALGYKPGDLPITEEYSVRLLRLPLWADMSDELTQIVIENFKHICAEWECHYHIFVNNKNNLLWNDNIIYEYDIFLVSGKWQKIHK